MATPEPDPTVPKTFISYSWDDDAHKEWVKQLATRLRADGVDVMLDRWHSAPGDQIPAFMERAVRENDFVIAVCTPRFKERSEERGGGVGYEGDIMTAYAFTGGDKRKFIPVLRRGSWREAAPTWLLGRAKIDLSRDPYSESEYEELLRTLHGAREEAPPIGHRPNFGDKKGSQASPAPAPVTPLVGSSTPQHQSSVTPGAGLADGLRRLALRDRRKALVYLGASAAALGLAGTSGMWWVATHGRTSAAAAPPPRPIPQRLTSLPFADVLRIIYTESPSAPASSTARAALQIDLEARRHGEREFTRLKDGDTLTSRVDDYRVVAKALSPGYLYLFQVDAAGKIDWLFPRNATSPRLSRVEPARLGPVDPGALGGIGLGALPGHDRRCRARLCRVLGDALAPAGGGTGPPAAGRGGAPSSRGDVARRGRVAQRARPPGGRWRTPGDLSRRRIGVFVGRRPVPGRRLLPRPGTLVPPRRTVGVIRPVSKQWRPHNRYKSTSWNMEKYIGRCPNRSPGGTVIGPDPKGPKGNTVELRVGAQQSPTME